MITLHPTVVIGLGSSGARMVEGIQQRMYEMFKVNSLPIFQYVVIETNRNYGADATPRGQDIQVLSLSSGGVGKFENFEELLDQLHNQDIDPDWIDRDFARHLVAQGEGAGGVRPVGRLILWANLASVRDAINTAKEKVLSDSAIRESEHIVEEQVAGRRNFRIATTKPEDAKHAHAVVCGTSTGGTYSGGFIDLGYLCQRVLEIPDQDRQSLSSITLLPPAQMTGREPSELHRFKGNAYGSLLEKEYFSEQQAGNGEDAPAMRRYQAKLPGMRRSFDKVVPPFDYSYLISQEYGGGALSISTPSALCQLASLKLFCDLMGLEGKRVERIVDRIGAGQESTMTFGLAAIMHPQYQISEYAACEAGIQLCRRWTDDDRYVNSAGQENPVPSPSTLETLAQQVWEGKPESGDRGLLGQKMDQLTSQEADLGGFFAEEINNDVKRLLDGKMKAVLRSFLEGGDTYYGRIKRNVPPVTDELAEELEAKVTRKLEETQSLPYAISYAEALRTAADDLVAYWDELGVPEEHSAWNDYVTSDLYQRLDRILTDPLVRVRNLLTTRAELVESVLVEAVRYLKVHLLRPRIETVKERLEDLVARLKRYRRMTDQARKVLEERKAAIKNDVEDESLPIGLVWETGSFESDVDEVVSRIAEPRASATEVADATDDRDYAPTSGTTWMAATLGRWHDEDEDRATGRDARGVVASEKIKLAYQQLASTEIDRAFDVDLAGSIRQRMIDQYFSRGQQCHLRYKRPDGRKVSIGDYLIGPESEITQDVRRTIRDSIGTTFDDEHTVGLPGIDHMLLYYREEVVGSPLEMLDDREDMKRCYEEAPTDPGINPWTRENWTDLRIAYDVPRRLEEEEEHVRKRTQTEQLRALLRFVGTFFFRWERQNGQTWVPTSVVDAASDLPLSVGPGEEGGPPRPRWVVKMPQMPARGYTVVDAHGHPPDTTIDRLLDDPETAQKVIREGVETIRSIGRDELVRLWDEHVMERIEQRHGSDAAARRARKYFGDGNSNGLVDEFLS